MASTRARISVVDDNESVRESLPDLLQHSGLDVDAFVSAEAFLDSQALGQTNCLILDVGLPGMSGPDLQQELKRRGQHIPIICITAQGDKSLRPQLIGRGAVAVLFKPFSDTSLLDAGQLRAWDELGATTMFTAIVPRAASAIARRENSAHELRRDFRIARADQERARDGGYTGRSSAGRTGTVAMPDVKAIVFVVDDDISVRESLELLITSAAWRPEMFVSAQDFLARQRSTVPCCLVLDVSLPGLNGLELQQQLAERTEMPIIFITGYGDVPMTVRAMKAGAIEFLTKPFKDDALLDAIRSAIERSRAALQQESEMQSLRSRYGALTPREREVMVLVCAGLLNKQVGGELGISEITVKAHRGQMMRKMKADSLPELVTMAARLALGGARSV